MLSGAKHRNAATMGEGQAANGSPGIKKNPTVQNKDEVGSMMRDAGPSAVAALVMLGLVFGGCCSNVGAHLSTTKHMPQFANLC